MLTTQVKCTEIFNFMQLAASNPSRRSVSNVLFIDKKEVEEEDEQEEEKETD